MAENKCIHCECDECKTKFDIWVNESFRTPESEADKDPEVENKIRGTLLRQCPVCNLKK